MEQIRISEARKNMKQLFDEVCASMQGIQITRPNSETMVVLSLSQYDAMIRQRDMLLRTIGSSSQNRGASDREALEAEAASHPRQLYPVAASA